MSRSRKQTPVDTHTSDTLSARRILKRLRHKRERARVRMALQRGHDADFAFLPTHSYDIGDGKTYLHDVTPAYFRK